MLGGRGRGGRRAAAAAGGGRGGQPGLGGQKRLR
jgi:hypothetical protein